MPLFGKKKDTNPDPYADMMQGGMPPPAGSGQDPYGAGMDPAMQDPYANPNQDYYQQQAEMPPAADPQMPPLDPGVPQGMPPPAGPDPYAQPQQDPAGFSPSGAAPSFSVDDNKERIEEIAEAIIDEKWNVLVKDINKVIEWKERSDNELKRLSQEIVNLKERFESLHKGVLGKISDYDQNLSNVGTEIKAMEKVFQNVLPTLTESIHKLERLSKGPGEK